MANKTITQLDLLEFLSDRDELAIYDNDVGKTGKITVGTLSNIFASHANIDGKQDKLTAGTGITLDNNNNISVKLGTEITSSTTVAATPALVKQVYDLVSTKQDQLTVGNGLEIVNNTISIQKNLDGYTHSRNPDSNDFNDFTSPGKYAFGTGQTPLNGPDASILAWVLIVIPNTSGNYIQQIATAMVGVETYKRYYNQGTWSNWIRFDNYEVNRQLNEINSKLGSSPISSIGDGTITGAISSFNDNLANIGTVKTGYLTTTTSIPDNTATALAGCNVTLSEGIWIIIGKVSYQGGTIGTYRQARIGTTATGQEYGVVQFEAASNNRSAMVAAIATETVKTGSRTFYLSTQHGNGSATTVAGGRWNTFIQAVRII